MAGIRKYPLKQLIYLKSLFIISWTELVLEKLYKFSEVVVKFKYCNTKIKESVVYRGLNVDPKI